MKGTNADRVRQIIGDIADAQRQINQLAALERDEFFADFRNVASVKYLLITAVEGAIDICNHIDITLNGLFI